VRCGLEVESVPASVPGAFVVDLLEDTGMMDRGEAELLMSWIEWVEVEAQGVDHLVEGLHRLRGAVMKAAVVARQATLFGAGRDSAGGEQGAGTGMRD
jgi:hypothetical protein